ncbi:tyrosine-protein phosphatase [Streptomyces lonarensis]|uniref:Tyrosine-protein phosphatase n=1 Tax=Streptomyces lonarensis TaxID=700599 RepID=A0A7X6D217_9ACTN|nr:tyrosine-protein phosphatase [Streptomyces lonarensis]NJQ06768.1 tyrosine-protein phosphatase [Streptomyces lonarensis]
MTQQQSVEPVLTGVRNFRDLGGLPARDGRRVRHGRLFRSGHLARATDQDRAFLAGLGLRTVFDLRNAADRTLEGLDIALPGVRGRHVPLTGDRDGAEFWALVRGGDLPRLRAAFGEGRAEALMAETYREVVRERTTELGTVLRSLASDGAPALVHCSAGKDRAGLTVALALLVAGVEPAAVEADYLLSGAPHHRYRLDRATDAGDAVSPEIGGLLAPLFDARGAYLTAAWDEIDAGWGSLDRYVAVGLGLSAAERRALEETLLAE